MISERISFIPCFYYFENELVIFLSLFPLYFSLSEGFNLLIYAEIRWNF